MAYWYGWALFILVFATFKKLKIDIFDIKKEARITLIIRGTIGVSANICYLISLTMISMSKASVLFWTNPLVIALLGRYLLKEKLSYYDWAACLLAFMGILLI